MRISSASRSHSHLSSAASSWRADGIPDGAPVRNLRMTRPAPGLLLTPAILVPPESPDAETRADPVSYAAWREMRQFDCARCHERDYTGHVGLRCSSRRAPEGATSSCASCSRGTRGAACLPMAASRSRCRTRKGCTLTSASGKTAPIRPERSSANEFVHAAPESPDPEGAEATSGATTTKRSRR